MASLSLYLLVVLDRELFQSVLKLAVSSRQLEVSRQKLSAFRLERSYGSVRFGYPPYLKCRKENRIRPNPADYQLFSILLEKDGEAVD